MLKEQLEGKGIEADIVLHDQLFKRDEDDLSWAQWAESEERIVLTRDLFRNEYQRRILTDYRGIIVILPAMNTASTVDLLVRIWSRIAHLWTQGLSGCYRVIATTGRLTKRRRR